MAESFIQLPADSTGKKVRTFQQTVGANVVEHQGFVLCDASGNIVDVLAAAPAGTERGIIVRDAGVPGLLTGGTQKAIARGGAKGATGAADITSTAEGADHQAQDVQIYHGGTAISPLTDAQLRATAVPVSGDVLVVTGTGNAGGATPIAVTDARSYRWVSVQLVGDASASLAVTFEGSNDNTNWMAIPLANVGLTNANANSAPNVPANGISGFHGPLSTRYFRVRINSWVAGSVTATAVFHANPGAMQTQGVSAVVASALPAGTNTIGAVASTVTSTAVTGAGAGANPPSATSSLTVAANAARKGLNIENTGNADVSLGLGTAAIAGQGIVLKAGGGTWDGLISSVLWTGAVNSVTASGTSSTLAVIEL